MYQGEGHIKVKVKYLHPFKFYATRTLCKRVVCIRLKCYLFIFVLVDVGVHVERVRERSGVFTLVPLCERHVEQTSVHHSVGERTRSQKLAENSSGDVYWTTGGMYLCCGNGA